MRTGAASGYVGNFHEAGFYGSDEEFLALIVPFVTDGLAAGEPLIARNRRCPRCQLVLTSYGMPQL